MSVTRPWRRGDTLSAVSEIPDGPGSAGGSAGAVVVVVVVVVGGGAVVVVVVVDVVDVVVVEFVVDVVVVGGGAVVVVVVVVVGGAAATVSVRFFVADPLLLSVTRTVNVDEPEAAGVPPTTPPVLRVRPPGSAPDDTDQV